MEPTQKEVLAAEKWSNLLRQELGHPVYAWQWSEHLIIRMRDLNNRFDYVANPATGLIEVRPIYIERRVCHPTVENQWVLCRLITTEQRVWLKRFGGSMEWPENGRWTPLNGPGGFVALPCGAIPDRTQTEKVIRVVRETQAISEADFKAQINHGIHRREAEAAEKRRNFVFDEVPKLLTAPRNTVYSLGADAPERKEVTQ